MRQDQKFDSVHFKPSLTTTSVAPLLSRRLSNGRATIFLAIAAPTRHNRYTSWSVTPWISFERRDARPASRNFPALTAAPLLRQNSDFERSAVLTSCNYSIAKFLTLGSRPTPNWQQWQIYGSKPRKIAHSNYQQRCTRFAVNGHQKGKHTHEEGNWKGQDNK